MLTKRHLFISHLDFITSIILKFIVDKGFKTMTKVTAANDTLFRQNLFYLSFLPKTEKCT